MSTHAVVSLLPARQPARLDKFMAENVEALSREAAKRLITGGHVQVNDAPAADPAHKVKPGDVVRYTPPPPEESTIQPQDIPLNVLYEDDQLIVINKPPTMAVHPAAGTPSGTLVNALLFHCEGKLSHLEGEENDSTPTPPALDIGGVIRPGIVHRLDKGTSGVMVAAKTDAAHAGLAEQFASRTINRQYIALCYGVPTPRVGEVETLIGRDPKHRKRMGVVGKNGKLARTGWQVEEIFAEDVALVRLKLFTGRTHQIRVHMKHLNRPLLGDPLYGRPRKLPHLGEGVEKTIAALGHQMLHAEILGFTHPVTGEALHFSAPPPADMAALLSLLRQSGNG